MKVVKYKNAIIKSNSSACQVSDYHFGHENFDLAIAQINGRYPEKGYCLNEKCDEIAFLIEGQVTLTSKGAKPEFLNCGDGVLLNAEKPYSWNGNCKMIISCSPAWYKGQYKIIK